MSDKIFIVIVGKVAERPVILGGGMEQPTKLEVSAFEKARCEIYQYFQYKSTALSGINR